MPPQLPYAGDVTIPGNESRLYEAKVGKQGLDVSLVELIADSADDVQADLRFEREGGGIIQFPRSMDDGPDDPESDLTTGNGDEPIDVSNLTGATRYPADISLDPGARIKLRLNNTNANARDVRFRISPISSEDN